MDGLRFLLSGIISLGDTFPALCTIKPEASLRPITERELRLLSARDATMAERKCSWGSREPTAQRTLCKQEAWSGPDPLGVAPEHAGCGLRPPRVKHSGCWSHPEASDQRRALPEPLAPPKRHQLLITAQECPRQKPECGQGHQVGRDETRDTSPTLVLLARGPTSSELRQACRSAAQAILPAVLDAETKGFQGGRAQEGLESPVGSPSTLIPQEVWPAEDSRNHPTASRAAWDHILLWRPSAPLQLLLDWVLLAPAALGSGPERSWRGHRGMQRGRGE